MSESASLVSETQNQNKLLASIQQCLANGVTETTDIVTQLTALVALLTAGLTVNTSLQTYTVAGLPASAPLARLAFATNGRNTGQGAGTGTGCVVVGNGAGNWNAVWSGVGVTA